MAKFAARGLVLFALSAFLCGCGFVEIEEEREEEASLPVEVYTVERGAMPLVLNYVGDIRGRRQVDVFPKVDGKLKRYEAAEGDFLEKGDVIAFIDRDVTGYEFAPAPVESPIAGIAARLYPDEGDFVSPGSPLAVVADMKEAVVRFSAAESDYPSLRHGQAARVRVDAYPDREFSGSLSRLSRFIDPAARTAFAELSIPNEDFLLIPGMFARIELVTGERDAVLAVRDAVIRRPGTGSYYSFVVDEGRVRRVRVRVGASSGEHIEILSGLDEGDRVVVSGHGILEDGARVEIVEGL
jgi:multidrug efflux pump subunit AcrA (membrane-fusion protein)